VKKKQTFNEVVIKVVSKPIWINIKPCIGGVSNGSFKLSNKQFVIYYGFKKPVPRFSNMGMRTINNPSGNVKIFRSMDGAMDFTKNHFRKYKVPHSKKG
jgi:hypothetical protein